MNKNKRNKIVKVKRSIRKFAMTELKRKGINILDGKPLSYSKNKTLFKEYKTLFGKNIADNFRPIQNNRDQKIIEQKSEPIKGYVYFIGNKEYSFCKIGFSKKPHVRLSQLQSGSPFILEMFGFVDGTTKDEKAMHRKFAKYRSHGEWFLLKNELVEEIYKLMPKFKA